MTLFLHVGLSGNILCTKIWDSQFWVVCKHSDPFRITQSDFCHPPTHLQLGSRRGHAASRSNLFPWLTEGTNCSRVSEAPSSCQFFFSQLFFRPPPDCQRAWSVKLLYICRDVASTSGVLVFWRRPVGLYPADRPMGLNPVVARPTWTSPEARDTAGRRRNLPDVTRSP